MSLVLSHVFRDITIFGSDIGCNDSRVISTLCVGRVISETTDPSTVTTMNIVVGILLRVILMVVLVLSLKLILRLICRSFWQVFVEDLREVIGEYYVQQGAQD